VLKTALTDLSVIAAEEAPETSLVDRWPRASLPISPPAPGAARSTPTTTPR